MSLAAAFLAVLALMPLATPAAASERWRAPVRGAVVAPFSFDRGAPFLAGRRRGVDLRGSAGQAVRAACTGVVSWAGRVPAGRGLALRCGRLVATQLGLRSVLVDRGTRVRAGAVVGRLGARGVLRLGARVAADRHGYVDPAALLGGEGGGAPPPAPVVRAPGRALPPPAAAPPSRPSVPRSPPLRPPRAGPADTPSTPVLAYAGLALLTGGVGLGGVARRRRTARRRERPLNEPVAQGSGRYR